ncbi:hypothetical protein PGIGA_G00029090 [Pangasianodon gigas]|uniref:Uncharacterized protein n=1 Tax=Pangasianodon gigas TaxID=30993 RepID=A0ACC5WXJ4_PANGG|nr:hypothetical protein [Pangasianodon gigas]
MRAETLITGLLLLRISEFHSLSKGQLDPKIISFSRGVHLVVKGIHVKTVAPKLQILLPAGLWMETCDPAILTCIITGLHTKPTHISWKINKTTVTQNHTTADIFMESDGTFTALGLFYPTPGHELKSDDLYRCEVEQGGITYYEEVRPFHCEQSL